MLSAFVRKVFGTKNDRELRRMGKLVTQVNALETAMAALDDAALQAKTAAFRQRIKDGASLDELLPEAFAVAREASKRVLGMRHFDVQLIGGITLHEGRIAEMRTGEGKTLMATLPVYLNALAGRGVHVVTVNDYLAKRDARWMGKLYEFLGMSVGVVYPGQDPVTKQAAYAADITYGTNNEYGFDFLRDNMALSPQERFQRDRFFAIIDEVDSILIDEARTPLIISGAAEDSSELYKRMNALVPQLERAADADAPGDFTVDEKHRSVEMTEAGHQKAEEILAREGLLEEGDSLYSPRNLNLLHHLYSAIRAHVLFQRDVEYIVQSGEVILIDEHTGRTMVGRRLSDGLHQAIEAKEGVHIQSESQTLASTTFQNYFRMYEKLGGMTGTADTEAFEFRQIYGLDVVIIPTNRPMIRKDLNDLVYLTKEEKFDAVIQDIRASMQKGAPVLVGTASIETSEYLSGLLKKEKIAHNVLNAKYHEREAEIIADAGRPGTVTIATNMAGRGTDIVLGGNLEAELARLDNPTDAERERVKAEWQQRHEQVIAAGGLHIIGTERHESRRIDNQLRGRSGRQGDPGMSRFYLSMEDNLMRIFASDRVRNLMKSLGMERGEAIEHRWVDNAIEKAQRKVEGHNFDIRKQLLEYDDVANEQRRVIYQQRNEVLEAEDISGTIAAIRADVVDSVISECIPPGSVEEQWDAEALEKRLEMEFGMPLPVKQWLETETNLHEETLRERIHGIIDKAYGEKAAAIGADMRVVEREIMLKVIDNLWKEHLAIMDYMRQGIGWRGLAGKNPKQEYKRESFLAFQEMLEKLKREVTRILMHVQIRFHDEVEALQAERREQQAREKLEFQHQEVSGLEEPAEGEPVAVEPEPAAPVAPFVREERKVGRNEPCPCGSGKKYKQCHGSLN